MKKINHILISIALPIALISCSNNAEKTDDAKPVGDTTAVATGTELPPAVITTGHPPSVDNMQTPNLTTTNAQPVAAGMNPAHGEPGHRCDIAVGASLSSPPTNTTATTGTPAADAPTLTPPVVTPQTTTPATATAPGMNPPHGEPGHDCAIAVGAPLKK